LALVRARKKKNDQKEGKAAGHCLMFDRQEKLCRPSRRLPCAQSRECLSLD
jgi:hypothetical protein